MNTFSCLLDFCFSCAGVSGRQKACFYGVQCGGGRRRRISRMHISKLISYSLPVGMFSESLGVFCVVSCCVVLCVLVLYCFFN